MYLNKQRMDFGIRLTHEDGRPAGDINYGNWHWRFNAPDGTQGPIRTVEKAAEYDALAYWEEDAAQNQEG